jgi:uncharacterized membrane protein
MGGGWWLVMALLLVAVVALLLWAAVDRTPDARSDTTAGRTPLPETATEILDRRLATGEITIEDYEQRRHTLESERKRLAA